MFTTKTTVPGSSAPRLGYDAAASSYGTRMSPGVPDTSNSRARSGSIRADRYFVLLSAPAARHARPDAHRAPRVPHALGISDVHYKHKGHHGRKDHSSFPSCPWCLCPRPAMTLTLVDWLVIAGALRSTSRSACNTRARETYDGVLFSGFSMRGGSRAPPWWRRLPAADTLVVTGGPATYRSAGCGGTAASGVLTIRRPL